MATASRSMSQTSRGARMAGAAVETDPMELTLLRSAELTRQRHQDRLIAEVADLRKQSAALRSQRAALEQQLADTQPASRRMDDSFAVLGRHTVWRHLGVWAAASRPAAVGGWRTAVRLKPDDALPAHALQLEQGRQKEAAVVKASVRDLPPGVRLDRYLERHGTAQQLPALVHAVTAEVDAFSSRRRQVAELREALPSRHSNIWHDPTVCDVSLQLQLNVGSERRAARVPVELNMQYSPGAALPHQCRVMETQGLDGEDREELVQLSATFLRLPLREAFREAFQ